MLSLRPSPRLRRMAAQVLVSAMLLGTVGVVAVERPAAADSVDDAKRKVREMTDQLEAAEAEADRMALLDDKGDDANNAEERIQIIRKID